MNPNFFGYWNQDSYYNNFAQTNVQRPFPQSSTSPYATSSNYTSPPVATESRRKAKKARVLFKTHQVKAMEEVFRINKNPNSEMKKKLEAQTGLQAKQVKIWFQNRRYKEKCAVKERAAKKCKSSSSSEKEDDDDLPAVYDQSQSYNPMLMNQTTIPLNMMSSPQQENFWCPPQMVSNWPTQPPIYPQSFPPQFNSFNGYETPLMFPAFEHTVPEAAEIKSEF
uniref:Homeobox domain-containing protein n=2 Tax=Bursaphelenchus xylophilus TaxID=6326 RepID=A0A1I7RNK8_BURXY